MRKPAAPGETPRRGSTLDEFLDGEGVRGAFEACAVEEVTAWQLRDPEKVEPTPKAKRAAGPAQVDGL